MVLDEIEVGEAKRQSGSKHSEVFSCVERADHQKLKRGFMVDEVRGCSVLEDSEM
jgi:hypothetical protein